LKFVIRFIVSLCVLWILIPTANAHKPLALYIIDQLPYAYVTKDGRHKGYLYEIGQELLARSAAESVLKLVPLKRLVSLFKHGRADCTIVAKTPLTLAYATEIENLGLKLNAGIIIKPAMGLNKYEDLSKARIAVPRGVSFDDRFDNDKTLIKVATKDYMHGVMLMMRGRVDGVAGGIESILYAAKTLEQDPETIFGQPLIFSENDLILACDPRLANDPEVKKIQKSLKDMKQRGIIKAISADFF